MRAPETEPAGAPAYLTWELTLMPVMSWNLTRTACPSCTRTLPLNPRARAMNSTMLQAITETAIHASDAFFFNASKPPYLAMSRRGDSLHQGRTGLKCGNLCMLRGMPVEKPNSTRVPRMFRKVWIFASVVALLLLWFLHPLVLSWALARALESWSSANHLVFSAEKLTRGSTAP